MFTLQKGVFYNKTGYEKSSGKLIINAENTTKFFNLMFSSPL